MRLEDSRGRNMVASRARPTVRELVAIRMLFLRVEVLQDTPRYRLFLRVEVLQDMVVIPGSSNLKDLSLRAVRLQHGRSARPPPETQKKDTLSSVGRLSCGYHLFVRCSNSIVWRHYGETPMKL